MSNSQRYVTPYAQAFDSKGLVAGAKLYFYNTDGTPAVSYADQGLSIPNPWPVVANAAGQPLGTFPDIWLNSTLTYKVVETDANGKQIWSANPYVPFGGSGGGGVAAGITVYDSIATLQAAKPATLTAIVYVQAYSTIIPTGGGFFAYVPQDSSSPDNAGTIIVDANGNRYYRQYQGPALIDYFGAVRDSGTTDNAGPINLALAACNDVAVPTAEDGSFYGFASVLTIPAKTRLSGFGKGSLLQATVAFGTGGPLIQNLTQAPANSNSRDDGIIFENLVIDGDGQGTACISLTAAQNFHMSGVTTLRSAGVGVSLQAKSTDATIYPENGWIADCFFSGHATHGVKITAGAEIFITDPVIDSCVGDGVQIKAASNTSVCRNIKLSNPIIRNGGTSGTDCAVRVDGQGSPNVSDISAIGGSFDAMTGHGVGYVDVKGLTVQGVQMDTLGGGGVARLAAGSGTTSGILLDGVKVSAATSDGFYLLGDIGSIVANCIALACGRDGVRLDGATHCNVTGGVFNSNTGIGLNEVNACDWNSFVGVQGETNTGGDFVFVGANDQAAGCRFLSVALSARCFVTAGSSPTLTANNGFTSVSHAGGSLYTFTMTKPMPSVNYIVKGNISAGSNVAGFAIDSAFTQTTTAFRIQTFNGGGASDAVTIALEVSAMIGP